jgi:NADPH2:quinone reductase
MKALLCKAYGPPESLSLEDVEPETIGRSTVRIQVRACGVNFPDVLIIKGQYQFKPPLPFAPGAEVSGDVIEVGSDVTRFRLGDRVIGMPGWNGFAEQVVVDEQRCLPLPPSMDYETGAAIGMTYGTGYHGLVQRGHLREGEWLLVHGAAGGVGTAAVDIGKALGARVIAAAGSDDKLRVVAEQYGLDHLVNYQSPGWKDDVKRITGSGADVIYDAVGGDVFEQSLRCINWEGRLLVIGFASGAIPAAKANLILLKGCSVVGVFWGAFAAREPELNRQNFEKLFEWHARGKLKPFISHRFPLERGAEALRAIIDRKVIGKAVVTVGG